LTLVDFRQMYPEYDKVPDRKLVDGLYDKYYKRKMSRQFTTANSNIAPDWSQLLVTQTVRAHLRVCRFEKSLNQKRQGVIPNAIHVSRT